jgi:hypothetical protein
MLSYGALVTRLRHSAMVHVSQSAAKQPRTTPALRQHTTVHLTHRQSYIKCTCAGGGERTVTSAPVQVGQTSVQRRAWHAAARAAATSKCAMATRAVLQTFERYQRERVAFVSAVAEMAASPANVQALQQAGAMALLRPLLLDTVPRCAPLQNEPQLR